MWDQNILEDLGDPEFPQVMVCDSCGRLLKQDKGYS